jgi:conjugative relaxase-like TrwC/TraI family protein
MVTAKTQHNLKNAQEYFEEHLYVGDYYDQGQRVAGEWIGLGAERLGLAGKVRAEDFLRLCENQHSVTGEKLTPELNTTRIQNGEKVADRRVFYGFTFSPPKSVSIAGLIGEDGRILEAHAHAVKLALRKFEAFEATRIRKNGAQNDRMTANFGAALFTHDISRVIDSYLHR